MSREPVKIEKITESRRDRFVRVAERRVNIVLDALDRLSKCSNKSNYEYNEKDIRIIFKAVEGKTREIKSSFSGTNSKDKKGFRLDGA